MMSGPDAIRRWVEEHLEQVRAGSGGWLQCRCPLHNDRTPSLSIHPATGVAHCHARCNIKPATVWQLAREAALPAPPDLRPLEPRTPHQTGPREHATWTEHGVIYTRTIYLDHDGTPHRAALRSDSVVDGKKTRPQHMIKGQWRTGVNGRRFIPWRLPTLARASTDRTLHIVEGERCAHALTQAGALATTLPMGSSHSPERVLEADLAPLLRFGTLVLWPDNDEPGRAYMAAWGHRLIDVGLPPDRLYVCDPWAGMTTGYDVADYLDRDTLDSLRAMPRMPWVEWITPTPDEEVEADEDPFGNLAGIPWPDPLGAPAYHGILGEIVRAAEPDSEADPAGILAEMLARFAHMVGQGPHFRYGHTQHPACVWVLLAGDTAQGRKGTASDVARYYCHLAIRLGDPGCCKPAEAFGSGEGVIDLLADKPDEPLAEARERKRVLAMSSEFSTVLATAARKGSTLAQTLRQAWDNTPLTVKIRNSRLYASDYHLALIGHLTPADIDAFTNLTDFKSGSINRFLIFAVRRSKQLPLGGARDPDRDWALSNRLRDAVLYARSLGDQEISWSLSGQQAWVEAYASVTDTRPGLLGDILGRGAAQVTRLAVIYALADQCCEVDRIHVEAALEVWRYVCDSAAHLFGNRSEDSIQDNLLGILRIHYPEHLTRTQIYRLYNCHQQANKIQAALSSLEAAGLITRVDMGSGGGRRATGYQAIPIARKLAKQNVNTHNTQSAIHTHTPETKQKSEKKHDSEHGPKETYTKIYKIGIMS